MANILYRISTTSIIPTVTSVKNLPLTNLEVDGNFRSIALDLSTKAKNGNNTDITSLGGITTALTVPQGGTGVKSITGLIKGSGTGAFEPAQSGIDYGGSTATLATGILKNNNGTGIHTIAVPNDFPTLNQNTTGNAATATNVTYSGLTGTVPTWNQNTTGNAATANNLIGTPTSPTTASTDSSNRVATTEFVVDRMNSAYPTGAIMHFIGHDAPFGFLKADGTIYSRSAYPNLFALIGTQFNVGNIDTTTFAVPDLRGEFIRGWDDGRGIDYTGGEDGDASFSRQLGTYQTHSNATHTHGASTTVVGDHVHGIYDPGHAHNYNDYPNNNNLSQDDRPAHTWGPSVGTTSTATTGIMINGAGSHSHTVTISTTGGHETRPRNIALLACIKY